MATWLEQTKRAIADMKSLGFVYRRDFTANTPYDHNAGGYDLTEIRIKHGRDQAFADKAEEIATMHYNVSIFYLRGRMQFVLIKENYHGKVYRHNYNS